jgi:hypothetical protein
MSTDLAERPPADASGSPDAAAYLARRSVAPQWRAFVRALVETLDEHLDEEGRQALMRAIGTRMAGSLPLGYADTLGELEGRINDALASAEWGFCRIAYDSHGHRLILTHGAAPAVGAGGDSDGAWAGAVLEGLYGAWLAGQPGANGTLKPRLVRWVPGEAVLHYEAA